MMTRAGLLALPVVLALGAAAVAQEQPTEIGQFGDWTAYTSGNGENRFCYLASAPQDASLRGNRDDIAFLIWHRPAAGEFDVVQVDIGYTFKQGIEATVEIGNDSWRLFTDGGTAWAFEGADDAAIVEAMRKGARMTVKGRSSRDNPTTDVYSLTGVTAGTGAINEACGR